MALSPDACAADLTPDFSHLTGKGLLHMILPQQPALAGFVRALL